ncbi:hypothetical protein [Mycobacterium sp.]|jgi:hypothetical protein|uniref:hypothetical protein n=1 Tax=Mycobacterium sp. TaxID=1785 RepID=UPI002D3D7A60|nr:hypothetical protein [Mycobacterium sp.]HZA10546.1 hypothetical protein [Mycobacterium sp.]
MRRIVIAVAAAALMTGSFVSLQPANAAQTTHDTTVNTPAPVPVIHALDCFGSTGGHGCGPGWFWRDGWRGWGCYPC